MNPHSEPEYKGVDGNNVLIMNDESPIGHHLKFVPTNTDEHGHGYCYYEPVKP